MLAASPMPAAQQPELIVAAASDLAPMESVLVNSYLKVKGISLRFVFGSSGLLARQIEQGAPYDVFLSADERIVRELEERAYLDHGSVRTYARGIVGLWSRGGRIRRLEDLVGEGVTAVALANPSHAPYGAAAKAVLERRGLWERLKSKVVMGENVRQAMQFAESGNADAAIVSWTLIHRRGGIRLPAEWHAPISQAGGVVRGSSLMAAGRGFLEWLCGEQGQKILEAGGLARIP